MGLHHYDNLLSFNSYREFHIIKDVDDNGNPTFGIGYGQSVDDNGEITYEFRINLLDAENNTTGEQKISGNIIALHLEYICLEENA